MQLGVCRRAAGRMRGREERKEEKEKRGRRRKEKGGKKEKKKEGGAGGYVQVWCVLLGRRVRVCNEDRVCEGGEKMGAQG